MGQGCHRGALSVPGFPPGGLLYFGTTSKGIEHQLTQRVEPAVHLLSWGQEAGSRWKSGPLPSPTARYFLSCGSELFPLLIGVVQGATHRGASACMAQEASREGLVILPCFPTSRLRL